MLLFWFMSLSALSANHESYFLINEQVPSLLSPSLKGLEKGDIAISLGFLRVYHLISMAEQENRDKSGHTFGLVLAVDHDPNINKAHELHKELLKTILEEQESTYVARLMYLVALFNGSRDLLNSWLVNVRPSFRFVDVNGFEVDCPTPRREETRLLLGYLLKTLPQPEREHYGRLLAQKIPEPRDNQIPSFHITKTAWKKVMKPAELLIDLMDQNRQSKKMLGDNFLDMYDIAKDCSNSDDQIKFFAPFYWLDDESFAVILFYIKWDLIQVIHGDLGSEDLYLNIQKEIKRHSLRVKFNQKISVMDFSNAVTDEPDSRKYILGRNGAAQIMNESIKKYLNCSDKTRILRTSYSRDYFTVDFFQYLAALSLSEFVALLQKYSSEST